MFKIKHLEGFSGIKLKNGNALEIKKGINLFVGKNGSGKSNLMSLISYILYPNTSYIENKKVFTDSFLNTICRLTEIKYFGVNSNPDKHINAEELESNIFCEFIIDGNPGNLKVKMDRNANVNTLKSSVSNIKFSDEFLIRPSSLNFNPGQKIKPDIKIGNGNVSINTSLNLFNPIGDNNIVVANLAQNFNAFFSKRIKDFCLSDPNLLDSLNSLKTSIQESYNKFFKTTNKKIDITLDPIEYGGLGFMLLDDRDPVEFGQLGDGEKNLFNLIVHFSTAVDAQNSHIIYDEPELFMHDDMVCNLAEEIVALSKAVPDKYIFISTHSSTLIEELAGSGVPINLITIQNKEVFNSSEDLDFVNTLVQNGVKFSPLYLSKRPNLFIENKKGGDLHRDFYLSLFKKERLPNIIPVGNCREVEKNDEYLDLLNDILGNSASTSSVGIYDGDKFFCKKFIELLESDKIDKVNNFVLELINITDLYIKDEENNKSFYFNFWEIENLYFFNDLLSGWSIDIDEYKRIILGNKNNIINSWKETLFWHYIKPLQFKPTHKTTASDLDDKLYDKIVSIGKLKIDDIEPLLSNIFDIFILKNVFQWFPGKEIYKNYIQPKDFSLDLVDEVNLTKFKKKVQTILEYEIT